MKSAFIALIIEVKVDTDDQYTARHQAEKVGASLNTIFGYGSANAVRTLTIDYTEASAASRLKGFAQP